MSCCGKGSGCGSHHSEGREHGRGRTDETQADTDLASLERLQRDLEQEVADVAGRVRRLKEEQQAEVKA